MTLKIRSRSRKSNQFFNYLNDTICKVWPESIIWLKRSNADKLFCQNLTFKVLVDLEKMSRSPKSNIFCPMSKWCFYASLVKIHQLVEEIVCRQGSFYSLYSVVTLKIRSMSPKSEQIFTLSQRYNIWSLARIRHLVQGIGCRQTFSVKIWKKYSFIVWWPWKLGQGHQNLIKSLIHTNVTIYMSFGQNPSFASRDRVQTSFFGQNLKISKRWYDLENEVSVTKIYSLLSSLPIMCLCKFGQTPPIGSGDRVQTMNNQDANADGIRTENNISPLPFGWGD